MEGPKTSTIHKLLGKDSKGSNLRVTFESNFMFNDMLNADEYCQLIYLFFILSARNSPGEFWIKMFFVHKWSLT